MYIDTRSKESMESSFCSYLNVSMNELNEVFYEARRLSTKDKVVDGDILNEVLGNFIDEKLVDDSVDNILFYHLSRRLNDYDEADDLLNLVDLLSTENSMSLFLKRHEIEFFKNDGKLDLYYKNMYVPLDDTSLNDVHYLRLRLGYNSRIDHCINGFALKDLIYKNDYTRSLWFGPEFIQILARFLHNHEIDRDYCNNSKFYCYEYCIPKSQIIFDDNQELLDREKTKYLVTRILHREYDYYDSDPQYLFDHNNSVLRLSDDTNLSNSMLLSKHEITNEMIE